MCQNGPKWGGHLCSNRTNPKMTCSRSDTAHPAQFTIQTFGVHLGSQNWESLLPEGGTGKGCRSVHSVFWLVLEPCKISISKHLNLFQNNYDKDKCRKSSKTQWHQKFHLSTFTSFIVLGLPLIFQLERFSFLNMSLVITWFLPSEL